MKKKIKKFFAAALSSIEAVIHDLLGPLFDSDDPDARLRNRKILGAGGRILILCVGLFIGFLLIKLLKVIVGV
ncbi:hypothetical protein [Parasphingorhabdus sp.]|uniref:hypothetical protein n=1 Tax=Parasphingorhabdus sp. TaxID=2709688 RepID=UPI00329A4F03